MQRQEQNLLTNEGILNKYALVVVDINALDKPFTYSIPTDLLNVIKIGSPVIVPFGSKGLSNGFVVGFTDRLNGDYDLKSIIEILDEDVSFSHEFMQLLIWMSKYYGTSLNTIIQMAFPHKLFGKISTKITKIADKSIKILSNTEEKILNMLELGKPISIKALKVRTKLTYNDYYKALRSLKKQKCITVENILNDKISRPKTEKYIKYLADNRNITEKQSKILSILKAYNEIKVSEFIKTAKTSQGMIKNLVKSGCAKTYVKEVYRNPLNYLNISSLKNAPELNEEQQKAYDFISEKLDLNQSEPVLLHGVTASGKTEVYFKLIDKVIKSGKTVMFLAPEIALASMLTIRLAERFGTDDIAVWHSGISEGEKHDIRVRMQSNLIKVLIGARSCIFAPLKNIGLIIVDEEHDSSYKQTSEMPYYNAVEVAEKLAYIHNALLLKGSATPDICSFYNAKRNNNLIEINSRFNNLILPIVDVIDMKEEVSYKGQKIFSRKLIDEISNNLVNHNQTILLLNRLGFSTSVICTSCGEVIKCNNCSIPLVYHKSDNLLKCHYCGMEKEFPDICPSCGSNLIRLYGTGVERIEDITKKLFPDAIVKRIDSESITKKNSYIDIIRDFETGKIDILVGTQMTSKGLDNENVTLVGVLNADSSFVFPDYRAQERGFQLLTQVAGRSGRGKYPGKVIFQTFNPEFSVINSARAQDYQNFYNIEINLRKEFIYPPFSQIISFIISGDNQERIMTASNQIYKKLLELRNQNLDYFDIYPPMAPFFERIRGLYRYRIIIKNLNGKIGHTLIMKLYKSIQTPSDVKIDIDPSPIDLL